MLQTENWEKKRRLHKYFCKMRHFWASISGAELFRNSRSGSFWMMLWYWSRKKEAVVRIRTVNVSLSGPESKSRPRQIIPKKGEKKNSMFWRALEASPRDWTSFLRCKKNNAFKIAVMKNLGLDPDSAKTVSRHNFQQNGWIRHRRTWIRNTGNKGNIFNVGSVQNHPAALDSVNLDPKHW